MTSRGATPGLFVSPQEILEIDVESAHLAMEVLASSHRRQLAHAASGDLYMRDIGSRTPQDASEFNLTKTGLLPDPLKWRSPS